MADFAPTPEQQEALRIFKTGANLKIRAGAGTGKTSTLVLLSKEVDRQRRRGRYVAFNKAIAVEAADKMPDCIEASTAHSLANRYCRRANPGMMRNLGKRPETVGRNGRTRPLNAADAAKMLGVTNGADIGDGDNTFNLTPAGLIVQATAMVNNFCKSADPTIGWWHAQPIKGADIDRKTLAGPVLPVAEKVWENLINPGHKGVATRFGHQHYLKWWALQNPTIDGDVLFLDEAQDTAPVLAGVLAQQTGLQIVLVGDSAQSIYRFTGAVDAMNTMGQDYEEARLTQSWRFGPTIAELANVALETLGDDMRVKGNPSINDTVQGDTGTPDAVLCRTNATAVATVIKYLDEGLRVNLEIDVAAMIRFTEAAQELQVKGWTKHPELQHFGSWDEVLIHAGSDTADEDWVTWVLLIKKVGAPEILGALSRVVPANSADITVSTAHKSKGREWDSVRLAGDLATSYVDAVAADSKWHTDDALMLIYVAITRAKKMLDPGALIDIPGLTAAGLLLRAERAQKVA